MIFSSRNRAHHGRLLPMHTPVTAWERSDIARHRRDRQRLTLAILIFAASIILPLLGSF